MKTVAVTDIQRDFETVLGSAQKERIVVMRGGRPSAVLVGIERYDAEDLRLAGSEEFWRLIEQRRRGKSIPISELRARLKLTNKTRKSSAKRTTKSRSSRSPGKRS
jgi:prevent-host-death family protein